MISFFKKFLKRKKLAGVTAVAIIAGGYFLYHSFFAPPAAVQYVTASAEKGTLVVAVTGTGQVSALDQVELKPKVSGTVVFLGTDEGSEVRAGTLIAQLDARDAEKAVRDAKTNLESAQLALAKLTQPADALSITQAKNALASAEDTKVKTTQDLAKARDDGFSAVANAFLDLPGVMTGLHDILYSNTLGGSSVAQNINFYANAVKDYDARVLQYRDDADAKYQAARSAYDATFQDYKSADRLSDPAATIALVNKMYETAKSIGEAVKSAQNLIQFYEDRLAERNFKPVALADTHLAGLNGYTGKTNTAIANLLAIQQTVANDTAALHDADRTITEKTQSMEKLKAGADALDIQSAGLTVAQRQNALTDAEEKLNDYSIRAPFDAVVAKINVKKSDPVSSAAAVATLITRQRLAEVSLNEVDVSKVKAGEKATMTFDAIDGLTIAGHVAQIDTIGTVAQGVVSYTVKISLDTADDRIKPGMSVSAAIVTDVKQSVIIVPSIAVKSNSNGKYVVVLASGLPQNKSVEIGLSNDTDTEIVSGIAEGDIVVTAAISASAPAAQSQQNTGLRIPGLTGGGGGGGGLRGGGRGN